LLDALFGQVVAAAGVDQLALNQEVAFGVGVKNLVGADAHLKQAAHGCGAHLFDRRQVGQPLGQIGADGGFVGTGQRAHGEQGSQGG